MINITNQDQSKFNEMDDYQIARYVRYAQAYAFVEVAPLAWEVKYFRKKSAKDFTPPNDVKPSTFV